METTINKYDILRDILRIARELSDKSRDISNSITDINSSSSITDIVEQRDKLTKACDYMELSDMLCQYVNTIINAS